MTQTFTPKQRDANEPEIVKALEAAGAQVVLLEPSEPGLPDLLVGWRGDNYLLEVKNPDGRNKLEKDQVRFHKLWHGRPIEVVRSADEALIAIGALEALKAIGLLKPECPPNVEVKEGRQP